MKRIRSFLEEVLRYILRKILVFNIGICVVVGISFLFTQGLNADSYSERMVWAGIAIVILGGLVLIGAGFSGVQFGVPTMIKKPEEAKRLIAHRDEIQKLTEERQDYAIQIWLIGLTCIGIAALVQVLLNKI